MTTDQSQFFKGLKVVEFASVLAGPAVGMFFAELGADVLKIENKSTGGDVTRGWKLPDEDPESPVSAYWCSVNWGKKHLFLDLKDSSERQQALSELADADVVISNFKHSFAKSIKLDGEFLRERFPALIFAQINSYADPEDERPAFDAVLQAEAGFMFMNGEQNGDPVKMPVALIDTIAAHQLKEGILLALLHRERSGKGSMVHCSLMESALASLVNQASNYLMTGHIPQRMGSKHPNIAPYGDVYACKDGSQILLAVGTEKQFTRLCHCLGLVELLSSEKFMNNRSRVENREELNLLIAKAVSSFSIEEVMDKFIENDVPAARIRNMKQVFEHPVAKKMILEEEIEGGVHSKRMSTVAFHLKK
ncbi:MAG: CoA transferase [Saprospiraceae bacterium]